MTPVPGDQARDLNRAPPNFDQGPAAAQRESIDGRHSAPCPCGASNAVAVRRAIQKFAAK
jgi:hypothetical protein